MSTVIDAPGLYYDIPADRYHADPCLLPSLSSGTLRTILDKSIEHAALGCPRLGGEPRESTSSMSLGSVVHALLAGEASDLIQGEFDSYRTAAAQKWKRDIEALGKIPVLERDLAEARPIVAAVRERAADGITNTPFAEHGRSEVTAVWREGDAWCRARFDRLVIDPSGYADIWDWKTAKDVSDRAIERAVASMGYHIQAAFYLRGLAAVLPSHVGRLSFTFCFVEAAAPYHVRRVVLSQTFLRIGQAKVNEGLAIWQRAQAKGNFRAPAFPTMEVEAPAYLDEDDEISISDTA